MEGTGVKQPTAYVLNPVFACLPTISVYTTKARVYIVGGNRVSVTQHIILSHSAHTLKYTLTLKLTRVHFSKNKGNQQISCIKN